MNEWIALENKRIALAVIQVNILQNCSQLFIKKSIAETDETTEAQCAITEWSEFSECPPCGEGHQRIKRRKYVHKNAKKHCEV